MFTQNDLVQIQTSGISQEKIKNQIINFEKGFPFVDVYAPATPQNDGIKILKEKDLDFYIKKYDKLQSDKNIIKFVPASGAASRMFKNLFSFLEFYDGSEKQYSEFLKDKSFNSVFNFITNIKQLALYNDLKNCLKTNGFDIEKCIEEKKYHIIIDFLLNEKGLNYANLPKALLNFHQYQNETRTAFEEHLIEGANYCKNKNGEVFIHYTLSPEHKPKVEYLLSKIINKYAERYNVKFIITFSEQKSSTDTIAVDMDNKPFREKDGTLLFRPAGHGALIENLNDLKGEIIFIKNIDNVVPDRLKEYTYNYKKAIGGYLFDVQEKIFDCLNSLDNNDINCVEKAYQLITKDLKLFIDTKYNTMNENERIGFLKSYLNRPIRVCGMVKNEGEPGGGPFWIKDANKLISLQIVESSQIDMSNQEQKNFFNASTHFNPVDLVCGVKNYKGENFELSEFVDSSTGFISIKSKDGKDLKAQELPGLWNGAMAYWITIFVEVPIITFNPVKTINDLLRKEHQFI